MKLRLIGTILIWLLAAGCAEKQDSQFVSHLDEAIEKGDEIINITDLTDFDWDYLFIVAPYTRKTSIDKMLGFSWDGFRRSNIEVRDNIVLLIFTKGEKVIFSVDYYRTKLDFSNMADEQAYTRDEATIIVDYSDNGAVAREG